MFWILNFGYSILFRISIFELRISPQRQLSVPAIASKSDCLFPTYATDCLDRSQSASSSALYPSGYGSALRATAGRSWLRQGASP
jgi:hypothetical protein